jgi:hypothetical protein
LGYRTQASDYQGKGQIAYTTGVNGAVGSLLNTAGDMTLRKYGMRK